MRALTPIFLTLLTSSHLNASDNCASDAMIVFDGSGSMAEMGFNDISEPRIFEAREAIAEVVPKIAQDRHLGLLVYGPNGPDECTGLDVRFAPMANAADPIIDVVNGLEPAGSTPLSEAVELAAQTLEYKTKPATILVITDGDETCGGAPCVLAAELAADGLDTTVHVIGFKVRGSFFSWDRQTDNDYTVAESVSRCLSDRTGGTYTSAETLEQLIAAMRASLGCNLMF